MKFTSCCRVGVYSDIISDETISLNVKENPFKVVFESNVLKTYIIESSADLINWEIAQVINGTGDTVEYIPKSQPGVNARFFRIRLNR